MSDINGWAAENGEKLKTQETGCGALTGWDWQEMDTGGAASSFLPFFIKAGCVEDAIVSAGGPRIQCAGQGIGKDNNNYPGSGHHYCLTNNHTC